MHESRVFKCAAYKTAPKMSSFYSLHLVIRSTFEHEGFYNSDTFWGVVRSLINGLLRIYCRVRKWKNFENRSTFGEVMCKYMIFYRATLCVSAAFAVARCLSVCLSVRPSRWGIVPRRLQTRTYVQARAGSCLLVPRRLNFFETQK